MLFPHGQERRGPDHSSVRAERYPQTCAQDNVLVAQPSTPVSYFHLLRKHTHTRLCRPLIIFTPRQLLRLKAACSPVEAFISDTFQLVIGETDDTVLASAQKQSMDRVLLCSGCVYYDLLTHRTKTGDTNTAIVRLEQPYPLGNSAIAEALTPFSRAELVQIQDELANQGMWPYPAPNLPTGLTGGVLPMLVSRPEAAALAVGTVGLHRARQEEIFRQAFARHQKKTSSPAHPGAAPSKCRQPPPLRRKVAITLKQHEGS